MKLVIIETPYAGDIERNVRFARACMRDCLNRGEAPYASHLLYTQDGVLDDDIPVERALGIEAGLAWGLKADVTVVYVNLGVSPGMRQGILRARAVGRPVIARYLLNDEFRVISSADSEALCDVIALALGDSST